MPLYEYECPEHHLHAQFLSIKNHRSFVPCPECGQMADQIIFAPLMVKAAADVCYDSPIDGSPITSWEKRTEDLKRHGCREYDPGMKQDYHARIKESEAAMDKAIDATVEAAIEKMPTTQRGKLYSELTEQGVTLGVTHS